MENMPFDLNVYNLIGSTIFSGVGFVAMVYAKKVMALKPAVIGLTLLLYPFFISNTLALYAIGVALTAFLFINN